MDKQRVNDPVQPTDNRSSPGTLRGLTRLLVGGALLGIDELRRQLPAWERTAEQETAAPASTAEASSEEPSKEQPDTSPPPESLLDTTRYALLGLLFESQADLQKNAERLGQAERAAWRLSAPLRKPFNRLSRPLRRPFDKLVARGEAEVAQWVDRGRMESAHSRALAQTALDNAVDTSIGQVAQNPELQDLVQQQSSGLVNELVQGLRERSVSADHLSEGIARRLSGKPPRLAPPPCPAASAPPQVAPAGKRAPMAKTTQANLRGHYAGFTSRLIAFIVDVALISLTLAASAWLINTANAIFQIEDLIILGRLEGLRLAIAGGITTLYVVGYNVFFWVLAGQTPGQRLLGLRVLSTAGQKPSLWHALWRLLGYFVSALPLYLGFLWILIDDARRGWHDKLAGTCVIYAWDARPDQAFLTGALGRFAKPPN